MTDSPNACYLPVAICACHESAIDALMGVHVPHDDAMDVVVASWGVRHDSTCLVAIVDGGRVVAAVRLPDGCWAAGNAFIGDVCLTRLEAERRLEKRLKRRRPGVVGVLGQADIELPGGISRACRRC